MFRKSEAREASERAAIERYEALAKSDPEKYRRRVMLTAAAGYAAPFVFLALLIALVCLLGMLALSSHQGAAIVGKLALAVIVVGVMIVRSMFVKFDPPDGLRVAGSDAPALFAEIEKVRAALDGPRLDEVYLDGNLNAAIQQAPRYGLFGGCINRLVVGLPLMHALTTPQFVSVLAHEYGHLAGAHGKIGASIYRTREMWSRLYGQLSGADSILNLPLNAFIKRFAPHFDRLSFPLGRANELEADRAAARVAGAQATGDALMRVNLAARRLSDVYWPSVHRETAVRPTPDLSPQRAIAGEMSAMARWAQNEKWARAALAEETDFADTHPSTRDRLAAIGAKARLPKAQKESAAVLLGAFADTAAAALDEKWRSDASADWSDAHEAAKEKLRRLDELDARAGQSALDAEPALLRGRIAGEYRSAQQSARRFLEAVKWNPKSADAWLHAGCSLVELGDARGLKFLARAAEMEARFQYVASVNARQFHAEAGDFEAASAANRRAAIERARHEKAAEDVAALKPKDALAAHGLAPFALEEARRRLARLDGVEAAWLVRKYTDQFPGYYAYHLVIAPRARRGFDYLKAAEAFQDIPFDAGSHLWFAVRHEKWRRKLVEAVPGAEFFRNDASASPGARPFAGNAATA